MTGVGAGDEVAVFLPRLGGYAELVVADYWARKPESVTWTDAAAVPASGEAAVRVLGQLGVTSRETLVLLGGAGSVGRIAIQLALARGVTVVAAVRAGDFEAVRELGAVPVDYTEPLLDAVGAVTARVDAVFDASGRSDLAAAIKLAGGADRVITLSDPRGPQLGVTLSNVVPSGVEPALAEVLGLRGAGALTLQPQTVLPLADAAVAHGRLDSGDLRSKVLLEI